MVQVDNSTRIIILDDFEKRAIKLARAVSSETGLRAFVLQVSQKHCDELDMGEGKAAREARHSAVPALCRTGSEAGLQQAWGSRAILTMSPRRWIASATKSRAASCPL